MNGNYYYGFHDTYWFIPDHSRWFAFRFLAIDSDNRWTVGDSDTVWSISSSDSVKAVENVNFQFADA
jgi:hypothetical protein